MYFLISYGYIESEHAFFFFFFLLEILFACENTP